LQTILRILMFLIEGQQITLAAKTNVAYRLERGKTIMCRTYQMRNLPLRPEDSSLGTWAIQFPLNRNNTIKGRRENRRVESKGS